MTRFLPVPIDDPIASLFLLDNSAYSLLRRTMPTSIMDILRSGAILLCDGAMGTELQKSGLLPGGCPEELNVTRPEAVLAVHQAYYTAGSDLVETNSFGGNRIRLAMHGMEHRSRELCRKAAELAREVCPEGRYVAGSIGPTGDLLEPFGTRSVREVHEVFAEAASALAEGGADVLFVETMMALEEAVVAVRAAKECTALPVVATMTFERTAAGLRTAWGVSVQAAVQQLSEAGADVLGANCGRGFDEMIEILTEMRPLTSLPVAVQANAGLPEWVDGVAVYRETPETMRPKAEELLHRGANILGGCCGTGPAHIRLMRTLVDDRMRLLKQTK